jgi:hypothetical protein
MTDVIDDAEEQHNVFEFIGFMNRIVNATENFKRSATDDDPPDVNEYYWIEKELLPGHRNTGVPAKFVETLRVMFEAWAVWNVPPDQTAAHFAKAKAAYERLANEEGALWDEHERRRNEAYPPSMKDIAAMFAALPKAPNRFIKLLVGAYGRCDMFYLKEGLGDAQRTIADLSLSDDATLAALRSLDHAVKTDDHTVFRETVWFQVSEGKTFADRRELAAPLYERRKAEAELMIREEPKREELKRGHKAFGFYPLDGGK